VEDIVEVKIKRKEINFIIWALPIISVLIGGWLLYKYYSSLGPLVEIYFKNSGGLEPKKSFVRFRDVKVGVVEDVVLLKKGVLVKVRMHKDAKPFLNETTKFWIVKPTVEIGKIQGLEALITGPYIQMYAKEGKFSKTKFKGLDSPPLDSDILNGKIIKLVSQSSYSLKEKMPVYYKEIKVGSIRRVVLNGSRVNIFISIKKEFAKYVNDTTKFWNIRGIDVSFDKDNLKMEIPGISQLLIGGIEFDTLDNNAEFSKKYFILYPSRSDAFENKLGGEKQFIDVVMIVKNDKNGLLRVGNPLMYKNFKVGYLSYMKSSLNLDNLSITTVCDAKLDVSAFGGIEKFKEALKKGLKASIVKNNPIFDNVKIKLFFSGSGEIKEINGRYVLPVVKIKEENIMNKVYKLLDKLSKIDYEKNINYIGNFFKDIDEMLVVTLKKTNKTLDNLNHLLEDNETKNISKNLNETLKEVKSLAKSYSKGSIFFVKLNEILNESNKALKLFKKIEKKIDNKPNVLIFGE
jgi:paraquat-inducible protein B